MEELKNGFSARKCNFCGTDGYMVSQYIHGKKVVSQFISEEGYEAFCKSIGCVPVIDEQKPVFPDLI